MENEFLERMHLVFENDRSTVVLQKELVKTYQKTGQLEVEWDFFLGLLKSIK